jgi:hypothetical protein
MPGILRPDLKAVVWAGIGLVVVPVVLRKVAKR